MGKDGMTEEVVRRVQRIIDLKKELADEEVSLDLYMNSLINKGQGRKQALAGKIAHRMARIPAKRRSPTQMDSKTALLKIVKYLRTAGGGTCGGIADKLHLTPTRIQKLCKQLASEGKLVEATVLVRNKRGINRPFSGYKIKTE